MDYTKMHIDALRRNLADLPEDRAYDPIRLIITERLAELERADQIPWD